MKGKEKCKALKEIRRQIAKKNDIEFVVSECKHQGDCKGTCPKCEAELQYLERELARRQSLGKAVCIVGISAAVCSGLTACKPEEDTSSSSLRLSISTVFSPVETLEGTAPAPVELDGDVEIWEPDTLDGDIATYEPEGLEGEVEIYEPETIAGDIAMPEEDE